MAAIDERLIDPTPDALVSCLFRATKAANGRLRSCRIQKDRDFWQRLVKRAARARQGSHVYLGSRSVVWGSPLVRVGWWTDPVGRRHWRVVGRRSEYADFHLKKFPFAAHPLWHVYPDRLTLRQGDGPATLLARCDCGACGPLERIAWMGERCGPCHDRVEEELGVHRDGVSSVFGHPAVCHLAFAGADTLVSGGTDGRIFRWNLDDGGRELLLYRRGGTVRALAASPSGVVAASTGAGRVLIRRPDEEDWRQLSLRCGHVGGLCFSPDERWLAVAGANSYLVDLRATGLPSQLVLADRCVGPLCFSADSRGLWVLDVGAELHRIDVTSGRGVVARGRPVGEPGSAEAFFLDFGYYPFPRAMASSPDGRWLAVVASWDEWFGTQVADLATGRWFSLRATAAVFSHQLAFTSENLLASADSDGVLRVWDVARQKLRATLLASQHLPSFQVPAFSPDGQRFALASHGLHVMPWRTLLG